MKSTFVHFFEVFVTETPLLRFSQNHLPASINISADACQQLSRRDAKTPAKTTLIVKRTGISREPSWCLMPGIVSLCHVWLLNTVCRRWGGAATLAWAWNSTRQRRPGRETPLGSCVCFQWSPYLLRCVDHADVISELQRSQDGGEDGENKCSRHCLEATKQHRSPQKPLCSFNANFLIRPWHLSPW